MWWSGDCAHCWARWAGICRILGGKFYILGVIGYNTPIWDVLALQGVREEAGGHFYGKPDYQASATVISESHRVMAVTDEARRDGRAMEDPEHREHTSLWTFRKLG